MAIRGSSPTAAARARTCAFLVALLVSPLLLPKAPARAGPPEAQQGRRLDRTQQRYLLAAVARLGARSPGEHAVLAAATDAWLRALREEQAAAIWFDDSRKAAAGAAQVAGLGAVPFAAAALRLYGSQVKVWEEPEPDRAPSLHPDWLKSVRDEEQFLNIGKIIPQELTTPRFRDGYQEYLAYCQALAAAKRTAPDLFARTAAEHPNVYFDHVWRDPKEYRGEVLHFEGLLKRVERLDAPVRVRRDGVQFVYDGWVFLDRPGTPPLNVQFLELPRNIKEGEKLHQRVSFDGYFFKKHRYLSAEKDKDGRFKATTTLLFIAPTLTVVPARKAETASAAALPRGVLIGVIAFVAVTIALIAGVSLWYRRNDRQVRSRLQQLRAAQFSAGEGQLTDEAHAAKASGDEGERNGASPGEGGPGA
jgi:hypothetical protein